MKDFHKSQYLIEQRKLHRSIKDLDNIFNKIDPTDIQNTVPNNDRIHILLGVITKINHVLSHKENLTNL